MWDRPMKRKKVFFVYMNNNTNRDDDEVYKVMATDEADAKRVASEKQNWAGRFSIGWAMPWSPKSKRDREFLKSYRWWATDKT